jgi:hypothetical protein
VNECGCAWMNKDLQFKAKWVDVEGNGSMLCSAHVVFNPLMAAYKLWQLSKVLRLI